MLFGKIQELYESHGSKSAPYCAFPFTLPPLFVVFRRRLQTFDEDGKSPTYWFLQEGYRN